MPQTDADKGFLEQAYQLAERGRGLTSPNPVVGAVVVLDGRAVGQGFHAGPGKDHAEVVAIKDVARAYSDAHLTGGTMYVTLEPCCHYGRTPPCTDALIRAGFSRVVVGAGDPSERVNGQGLRQLREAGIAVDLADGELAYRFRRQNDAFRKHATQGLPFVTYKYAMTLDGRAATETGHSQWITGERSRGRVQQERAWSDAVMVGAGTLRADNPLLTVRAIPVLHQPLRVAIDPRLSIERSAALVETAESGPVLVVCSEAVSRSRREEVASWGVEVAAVPGDPYPEPRAVARLLGERDVQSVLLEGGPTVAAAWWTQGLVDRVQAFVAPVVAGGAHAPGPLPAPGFIRMDEALRLRDITIEPIGDEVLITAYLGEPA